MLMAQIILSDENCIGHVEALYSELQYEGYVDLLEIKLLSWEEAGLEKGIDDETLWKFCQQHQYLLITGNRTGDDEEASLEFVVRRLIEPTSLPVLTISNLKRIMRDRSYRIACAQRLADIIFELEIYRGITRIYLQ
jgi:hypothetical protein